MASMCVSASTAVVVPWAPPRLPQSPSPSSSSSASSSSFRCGGVRRRSHVVRMAPEGQRTIHRSPLDFPIIAWEWARGRPASRPDAFPNFSPMKTPLPVPMPVDPPLEIEEEEYEEEEEEQYPDQEENPENY